MTEPILVIESQPERELDVRTLGRVRVRQPELLFHRQLAWRRRRPLAANHRAFASAAIAVSVDPPCSPAEVDRLPGRDRRRLMRAVVCVHGEERAWRRLAGSFLSADERFFAVMLWAAEREQAEHRRALAELRNARESLHRDLSVTPDTLRTTYGVADVSRKLQLTFGLTDTWTRLQKKMDFYLRGPLDAWESLKGVHSASHASAAARALTLGTSNSVTRALGGTDIAALAFNDPWLHPAAVSNAAASLRIPQSHLVHADVTRMLSETAATWLPRVPAMKLPALEPTALRFALGLGGAGALDAYTKGMLGGLSPAAFGALAPPGHPLFASAGMLNRLLRLPTAAYGAAVTDSTFAKLAASFRWLEEGYALWDAFAVEWENDPLWLILGVLDYVLSSRLFGLARADVEMAVLTALTEVVLEGRLISAMRAALAKAPHLNRFQRELLDEGLVAAAAWRGSCRVWRPSGQRSCGNTAGNSPRRRKSLSSSTPTRTRISPISSADMCSAGLARRSVTVSRKTASASRRSSRSSGSRIAWSAGWTYGQ